MTKTRVQFCDQWGGVRGDLAWRVMYQFDEARDLWAPLSVPFATADEARNAEIVLRGERPRARRPRDPFPFGHHRSLAEVQRTEELHRKAATTSLNPDELAEYQDLARRARPPYDAATPPERA